jgi:hypothetical protein
VDAGRWLETRVIIQDDSGGKITILGGGSIGHVKKVRVNMCLIVSGYRDRAV